MVSYRDVTGRPYEWISGPENTGTWYTVCECLPECWHGSRHVNPFLHTHTHHAHQHRNMNTSTKITTPQNKSHTHKWGWDGGDVTNHQESKSKHTHTHAHILTAYPCIRKWDKYPDHCRPWAHWADAQYCHGHRLTSWALVKTWSLGMCVGHPWRSGNESKRGWKHRTANHDKHSLAETRAQHNNKNSKRSPQFHHRHTKKELNH